MSSTITLSEVEASQLTQRATSQAGRADDARRARLILLLDAGHTWAAIRDKLDCTDSFIACLRVRTWRKHRTGLGARSDSAF